MNRFVVYLILFSFGCELECQLFGADELNQLHERISGNMVLNCGSVAIYSALSLHSNKPQDFSEIDSWCRSKISPDGSLSAASVYKFLSKHGYNVEARRGGVAMLSDSKFPIIVLLQLPDMQVKHFSAIIYDDSTKIVRFADPLMVDKFGAEMTLSQFEEIWINVGIFFLN